MTGFESLSATDALELSLENAEHLSPKQAAVVAAARQLAKRVDVLGECGWVVDGKLDNVTLPVYLRYLEQLGLTVPATKATAGKSPAEPESAPAEGVDASPEAKIIQMQQRAAQRRAR